MKKICSELLDIEHTNALQERINYKLKFIFISLIAITASLAEVLR